MHFFIGNSPKSFCKNYSWRSVGFSGYPDTSTISVPAGTYALSQGSLEITSNITVIGAGGNHAGDAVQTFIQLLFDPRVFDINPYLDITGFDVTLQALTISNGNTGTVSTYG